MTSIVRPDFASDDKEPFWVKLIFKYGVPTVGLACIIWWIITSVDRKMTETLSGLNNHTTQTMELIKQNQDLTILLRNIEKLNIRVCVNTARTDALRDSCIKQ